MLSAVTQGAEPPHVERLGIVVVVTLTARISTAFTRQSLQTTVTNSVVDGRARLVALWVLDPVLPRRRVAGSATPWFLESPPLVLAYGRVLVVVPRAHVALRALLALAKASVAHHWMAIEAVQRLATGALETSFLHG